MSSDQTSTTHSVHVWQGNSSRLPHNHFPQVIGVQECQHLRELRKMLHRHLGEWVDE